MTPSCSSISYFPSAQTRNSRNGPTAAFPEDSIPAHAGKTTPTRRPWCGSSAHPRSRGENQQRLDLGAESRGSSPLTRGKPRPQSWQKRASRLIPAHAGKTAGVRRADQGDGAHPRSRGENAIPLGVPFTTAGSSPLTRGKPSSRCAAPLTVGLIPAHAGKTPQTHPGGRCSQAHPRSRGENFTCLATTVVSSGSSPLTRGKLHLLGNDRRIIRLIPAHAGKTRSARGSKPNRWAHPRSRGENQGENIVNLSKQGSSPLTRGKPHGLGQVLPDRGLIPAHAGKTSACRGFRGAAAAHPRSRGENVTTVTKARAVEGSSPLTRGKPTPCIDRGGADRLIPAHAGKTSYPTKPRPHLPAHPRSRGENDRCDCRVDLVKGSSPLTRGKLLLECCGRSRTRLIPAHAGKTRSSACLMRSGGAHPRSRGENLGSCVSSSRARGSSPLTRGKQRASHRDAPPIRLIPAHAGKT